jgi:hypothetical protein
MRMPPTGRVPVLGDLHGGGPGLLVQRQDDREHPRGEDEEQADED